MGHTKQRKGRSFVNMAKKNYLEYSHLDLAFSEQVSINELIS